MNYSKRLQREWSKTGQLNYVKLQTNKKWVLLAYDSNIIEDEEYVLLFEAFKYTYVDITSWIYERFNLDRLTGVKCKAKFRFCKIGIIKLLDIL